MKHTELLLEQAITEYLVESGGYRLGSPATYDRALALDTSTVLEFLSTTQEKEWSRINEIHGENTATNLINRLVKELNNRGSLDVIRNGFVDYGVKFRLAYFQPETSLNETARELYDKNILTVTRQIRYSTKNENELDLVLFLNGIPVATVELKNPLTNQTVEDAMKQYKFDRDKDDPIFRFKQRALVHFAVDPNLIYLTTKLDGEKTRFLPFNQGFQNGAGNPPNEAGYRTSYLWEQVWQKDSWLDIIGKFVHLKIEEEEIGGRTIRKESIIFPRYHQLDVVRKLTTDSKVTGPGKNYLIQHSAGSGKSNSIAWLAYRLSNLHNTKDERVFQSVIVVTDRKVLDRQLQDNIYQFEHKMGVVEKIDKDSSQLADALLKGTNIIITTLQKFPVVLESIRDIPKRNYALIVDEAHSSQTGEASRKMKEVLSAGSLEQAAEEEADQPDEESSEDYIRKTMESRGKQQNLSFFAFTATPKAKTLEIFGTKGRDGKPAPFHLYSMRQAIEEGFIMDVLKGYTTYKLYFKLNKQLEDDPNIPKKKGTSAVARFVSLHPHNLAQKTEVIIEHFRRVTSTKIGGKAKAMVVTSSRLHAVRYKQEFDRYITEKGYTDLRTLVAFSGTVNSEGLEFKESEMNGFGEKELPVRFASSDYGVLIVAEKYQTGFDQPLLHTMYVDKKLSGVKAVQTLSRLNRTCPGKDDTFVLDFVNETDDIRASFQPYYELTTIEESTDPNHIYDLKHRIEQAQVIWGLDIDRLCEVYFSPNFKAKDHKSLYGFTSHAVERFKALPATKGDDLSAPANQEDFKHSIQVFLRYYSFISQVVNLHDIELEKFYTYCRFLERVLPKGSTTEPFSLNGDELSLEYYRLQKVQDNVFIELNNESGVLDGIGEAGLRGAKDDRAPLSEIIKTVNNRFGTDFSDADRLFIEQVIEDCITDQKLAVQAQSNSMENFRYPFEEVILGKWIDRMDSNGELFKRLMDDEKVRGVINDYILKQVYTRLRG